MDIPGLSKDQQLAMSNFQKRIDKINEKKKLYLDKINALILKKQEIIDNSIDNTEEWINLKLQAIDDKIVEVKKSMNDWLNIQLKQAEDWLLEQLNKIKEKKEQLIKLEKESLNKFK